jgi:ABC-type phosphate/phosphonate transport system substrate-binding protein
MNTSLGSTSISYTRETMLADRHLQAHYYCMHLYFESSRAFRKLLLVTCCGFAMCHAITSSASEPSGTEQYSCRNVGPIIFGILPFISAEQLVIRFTPLVRYLSRELRTPVRIETAPNFVEFARRTHEDQRYDILFTAPHFYPQARSKAGYRLIAGVDSPGMWAVIVVPRKSQIYNIDDLAGKRLATVHPAGLAT